MNWKLKCINPNRLFAVLLIPLLIVSGCKDKNKNTYDFGNPNADTLCYSSVGSSFEIENDSQVKDVLRAGEEICIIIQKETNDENQRIVKYTAFFWDEDSCERKRYITFDTQNHFISSFCYAGDNRIAGADTNGGYVVFNMNDGSILYDGYSSDRSRVIPAVSTANEGFVYVSDNQISMISPTGILESRITFDEELSSIPYRCAYFVKGNNEYVSLINNMQMKYYYVDFDDAAVSLVASDSDFDLSWPDLFNNGGYAYDQFAGAIYEIDPLSKTKAVCSYLNNMLVKPLYGVNGENQFYLLDKNEYAQVAILGPFIEMEIIRPDLNLHLTDRVILTVKGDNATLDKELLMAAYLYNSSQEEFFVSIENYGEEYGYETTEDACRRNLRLLQDFQRGDSPDMFYGNTLDYNYMGENGLVVDMIPLIEVSDVIGREHINSNAYNLFFYEGHCYQLFCGYQLFGLFGDKSVVDGKLNDISLYENEEFSETIRNRYSYSDLMCMMLSYPIFEVTSHPNIISEDEISHMLEIAVDIGVSPEDQANGYAIVNDNENTFLSYFGSYKQFLLMSLARNDVFTFVGYPTVETCVHMASPSGLLAVSAGTEYQDECFRFIEYLYSDEVQQLCLLDDYIPVKQEVFEEYVDYLYSPSSIPEDNAVWQYVVPVESEHNGLDQEDIIDSYISSVESVDGLLTFDWGLHLIVSEETNQFFYEGKDINSIASSMRQRILLYLRENSMYGY